MPDPTRLFVAPTGTTHPLDQKFDIFQTFANPPARVNLCGFSYFGEVGGLDLNTTTRGIDLRGTGDPAPNPSPVPPKYSLTFEQYMDKLRGASINFMRVFLFDEYRYRYYPFSGSFSQRFHLDVINTSYISRLKYFIEQARARGIIVCISFFSRQSLGAGAFSQANPFYADFNTNNVILGANGVKTAKGIDYFCTIQQPQGWTPSTPYNPAWTQPEKLWWIQYNLIREIVNATKDYWNVCYEPFNEPSSAITNIIDWYVTVTGWLKGLLWDAGANRRSRLVVVNAGDDLLDSTNFLNRLLPVNQPALFDVFDFHGGGSGIPSQWGGPHGNGLGNVCPTAPPPNNILVDRIVNGFDETRMLHHKGIKDAMNRFNSRPVALLFDTDAQYWAQRLVTPYLEEVLNVDGSFNYRWADTFLNAVSDSNCNVELTPLSSGLDQRLAKFSAARNRGRITSF